MKQSMMCSELNHNRTPFVATTVAVQSSKNGQVCAADHAAACIPNSRLLILTVVLFIPEIADVPGVWGQPSWQLSQARHCQPCSC